MKINFEFLVEKAMGLMAGVGLLALLAQAPLHAQYDADTLRGRPLCTATRTTNCVVATNSSGAAVPAGGGVLSPATVTAAARCASASSSATAYTCALAPAITTCATDMRILWTPDVTSGAAPTLNAGCGAKALKTNEDVAVATSQFAASVPVELRYDGTAWRAPAVIPGSAGGAVTGTLSVATAVLAPNVSPTAYSGVPLVIYDNDLGADHDAVLALAVLHGAEDAGLIKIVAETVTGQRVCGAQTASVLNTFFGRPDIPIGINLPVQWTWAGSPNCAALPASYPHTLVAPMGAVDLLRRILATAPDASITWVMGGPWTNLLALYNSAADDISPMTGAQLITAKTAVIWAAISNLGVEAPYNTYNCSHDIPACQLINVLTVPMSFMGYAQANLQVDNAGSPVALTSPWASPLSLATYVDGATVAEDPLGAFLAAYGLSKDGVQYFAYNATPGSAVVDGAGEITWSATVKPNHKYVTLNQTEAVVTVMIKNLVAQPPRHAKALPNGSIRRFRDLETLPKYSSTYAQYRGLAAYWSGSGVHNSVAGYFADIWGAYNLADGKVIAYPLPITNISGSVAVQNRDYITFNSNSYAKSATFPLATATSAITIAITFRATSLETNQRLISLGPDANPNAFSIQIGTTGVIGIADDAAGNLKTTAAHSISTATWYTAQLSFDYVNATLNLYVDGALVSSVAKAPFTTPDTRAGVIIGMYNDASPSSSPFAGDIRAAAMWEGNIDAAQVYRFMHTQAP